MRLQNFSIARHHTKSFMHSRGANGASKCHDWNWSEPSTNLGKTAMSNRCCRELNPAWLSGLRSDTNRETVTKRIRILTSSFFRGLSPMPWKATPFSLPAPSFRFSSVEKRGAKVTQWAWNWGYACNSDMSSQIFLPPWARPHTHTHNSCQPFFSSLVESGKAKLCLIYTRILPLFPLPLEGEEM